jgi:GTP cyclohydrolase I
MHLAYLPKSRAIGLSKIPRIVDRSRGRKSQERPTQAVAQTIHQIIDPVGG